MNQALHITIAVLTVGVLTILLLIFLRRWCCLRPPSPSKAGEHPSLPPPPASRTADDNNFQSKLTKLHQTSLIRQLDTSEIKCRGSISNYYVFRRGFSGKPLFSWADHPALVSDAVENGWSRFAFAGYHPAPAGSARSVLLGFCAGDCVGDSDAEIKWEVCNGSTDFMQKIRLNPGLRMTNHKPDCNDSNPSVCLRHQSNSNSCSCNGLASSVVRAALPLPGPLIGNAFPQEAYFEITVLAIDAGRVEDHDVSSVEGENIKLIPEKSYTNNNSMTSNPANKNEELKTEKAQDCNGRAQGEEEEEEEEEVGLCVGLTIGGSVPMKLPGRYQGSIGFNSNGSIYLDGIKLVFESEKHEWSKASKVIGCGFDPRKKKVFFTVDSHLAHVINCKAEEFGTPLYPVIAANSDATVLVNYGQSAFVYGPSNGQRTPNPCFISPIVRSPTTTIGFEDSKELFSMGRIDSQYLARITKPESGGNEGHNNSGLTARKLDPDDESDGDLFEIVIESSGKSPSTR